MDGEILSLIHHLHLSEICAVTVHPVLTLNWFTPEDVQMCLKRHKRLDADV